MAGQHLKIGAIAAGFVVFLLVTRSACAGGFTIAEQSASSAGTAVAGAAAVVEDATTVVYNPAGMTMLEGVNFVAATGIIRVSRDFDGSGQDLLGGPIAGDTSSRRSLFLIPSLFASAQLSDRFWAGFAVYSPFGLGTASKLPAIRSLIGPTTSARPRPLSCTGWVHLKTGRT